MTEQTIRELANEYTADIGVTPTVFTSNGRLWLKLSKGLAEASTSVDVDASDAEVRGALVLGIRFVEGAALPRC